MRVLFLYLPFLCIKTEVWVPSYKLVNIPLFMGKIIKDVFESQSHGFSFSKPLRKSLIRSLKLSFLGESWHPYWLWMLPKKTLQTSDALGVNEVGISRDNHNSILGKNNNNNNTCLPSPVPAPSPLILLPGFYQEVLGGRGAVYDQTSQHPIHDLDQRMVLPSLKCILPSFFFSLVFFLLYPILFLHVISGPRHDLTLDFLLLLFASGKVNQHGLFSDWHNLTMPSLASFTKLWGQEGWLSKLGIMSLLSKTQCSFPSFSSSSSFFFKSPDLWTQDSDKVLWVPFGFEGRFLFWFLKNGRLTLFLGRESDSRLLKADWKC